MDNKILELSPYLIQEKLCIKRFQVFLDSGYYPNGKYNKTWDMLAWLENNEKLTN